MKFLFAVPPFYTLYDGVPYGMAIVAAVAREAGLDINVHHIKNQDISLLEYEDSLVQRINSEKINVVCFAGMSVYYSFIKRLVAVCKAQGCITILGGNIVDPHPEIIINNIGVDYCIIGEGEETFKELAYALQNKTDVEIVKGIIYKEGDKIVRTNARKVIDNLDSLPFLDDDLSSISFSLEQGHELTLIGSRSCPYQCTFCYHLKGSYYRARSLKQIFEELDYYLNIYGDKIKGVQFLDEMINIDKERILEFSRRFKKYKLKLNIQTRIDRMDEEILIALKEAGCYRIAYGVESASNKILKSMKKNLTIEAINEKLELTSKYGIQIHANIIIGDLEEDEDTIRESEQWFVSKSQMCSLNIIMLMVFPGSYVYNYALEKGIIKNEIDFLEKRCPLINITKLSDHKYYLLAEKYKNFDKAKDLMYKTPISYYKKFEFNLKKNGKFDFITYCPKCFSKIEYMNISREQVNDPFRLSQHGCLECNEKLDLANMPLTPVNENSSLNQYLAEQYFSKYIGTKIAIWGLVDRVRILLIESQILRDAIVKIVDINNNLYQSETYCGLKIQSPESLKDVEFDYLIISTVNGRDAVLKSLDSMNIKVPIIDIV